MAKVILSALLDSLTGKLSGSVFQGTVGGLQVRSRVSPRNPRSLAQQVQRGKFSFNASSWSLLTDLQRASWNDNAPVGSTGIAFYLGTNSRIALTGEPLLQEFTPGAAPAIDPIALQPILPDDIGIEPPASPVNVPANCYLNIFATRQLSPGTSFISPAAYVFMKAIPPGTDISTEPFFSVLYYQRFGLSPVGSLIGASYYLINTAAGTMSDQTFTTGIVQAP